MHLRLGYTRELFLQRIGLHTEMACGDSPRDNAVDYRKALMIYENNSVFLRRVHSKTWMMRTDLSILRLLQRMNLRSWSLGTKIVVSLSELLMKTLGPRVDFGELRSSVDLFWYLVYHFHYHSTFLQATPLIQQCQQQQTHCRTDESSRQNTEVNLWIRKHSRLSELSEHART
jgi:hypothetical protein